MKVVILAGGFGTRISEESQFKPKPMIEIGGKPILWHIMKWYSKFGHNEFIICCGYKQQVIKSYFANYYMYNTLNPQLHSRSATYIKRNGLLIRKTAIKSSHPFQCAYYPLTPQSDLR
ncbi:sugar phosphate nucleotidyltransferase, partial [Phocaeicola sp.]|uniref:sugar phosphate nucleotidyltransferase n=1 Tax=Phocaeicola sp. TaxID=2773926 RepID=UPI003A8E216F